MVAAEDIIDAHQQRRVESQEAGTSRQATASIGKYVPPAARNQGRASDTLGASPSPITALLILSLMSELLRFCGSVSGWLNG